MSAGMQQFLAYTAQAHGIVPGHQTPPPGGMIPALGPFAPIAQPFVTNYMAQQGLYPGAFSGGVNVYDLMRSTEEQNRQMAMIATAAQSSDTQTWLAATRGALELTGRSYGLDQHAAFSRTYKQLAPYVSMLGQMAPDLVDSLHGSQGSAAVMVQNMLNGARYRAGTDGLLGMSPADIDALTQRVTSDLYGSPEKIAQMQGIGRGQLGAIFDEGARRGYLPSALSTRSRAEQLREIGEEEGLPTAELEKLATDDFDSKVRSFDAKRITGRLKELAGSVSAMREIFGAAGQPNAPMSQIINALEALTQNRLGTMPASQVEQIVRRTKAVMETTGTSLDGLLTLTSQAAQVGDGMGLDRSLAVQAGLHAATYGNAYKTSFGSDFRAFGAASADVVTQRDAVLNIRAAGSEQALFAGGVVRSVEALGLAEDSQLGRLAAAIKRGDQTFEGRSMYKTLSRERLIEMAEASGAGPEGVAAFRNVLSDKIGNQEAIEKYDIGRLVRQQQGEEIIDRIGTAAGENAIMQTLIAKGVPQEQARQQARAAGPAILRQLLETEDPEQLSTGEGRERLVQTALEGTFGKEEAAKLAPSIALAFETQMDKQSARYGYTNTAQLLQSQNKTILRRQDRVERIAAVEADIGRALAPLGKAGPIQRIMDLLQQDPARQDLATLFGKALGGIEIDDIKSLAADTQTVRQLASQGVLSADEQKLLTATRARIEESVGKISEVGKATGADLGRNVAVEDIDRAIAGGKDLQQLVDNTWTMDEGERRKRTDKESRMLLWRSNQLVQALYMDEGSLRKLGVGGVEQLKRAEEKYLQLMRLSGGSTEYLSRMLTGDESIPEERRQQAVEIQAALRSDLAGIRDELGADGAGTMTDEQFAAEKKKLEELRAIRMGTDDEQVTGMVDKLAALGGIDMSQVSDGDKASLREMFGGLDEDKRKDLMLAVEARQKIEEEAKRSGRTVLELRGMGEMRDAFAQAGGLGEFADRGQGEDLASLREALGTFGESTSAAQQQEMRLSGQVTITDNRTATIAGTGYTTME